MSLLTLAHKRITTLVYLKNVHKGKVHWFNTILLSRPKLKKWFEHQRVVTRTTKFAIVGMSLSSLLDINNLQDFLKAMINLLYEFKCIPNNNFKPKISSLSVRLPSLIPPNDDGCSGGEGGNSAGSLSSR
ncbi:hypothetical protein PtB15_17B434 [Puccinia triticina]|nr:hypothetical protein PtB15_17B434 [Puccinia triticina]